MPGRAWRLKTATAGVLTAAARCIGPLSLPRKKIASAIAAALTRGEIRPQVFSFGPCQHRSRASLRARSPSAPTTIIPRFGYAVDTRSRTELQFGSVQSLTACFVPGLKQMKLSVPAHPDSSCLAVSCSASVKRRFLAAGSSMSMGPRPSSARAIRDVSRSNKPVSASKTCRRRPGANGRPTMPRAPQSRRKARRESRQASV